MHRGDTSSESAVGERATGVAWGVYPEDPLEDPDHALDGLSQEDLAACLLYGRNCFVFLCLHVHPGQGGGRPASARLERLELVEGLVHLAGEVRLVAAYPLQVGLI